MIKRNIFFLSFLVLNYKLYICAFIKIEKRSIQRS